MVRLLRRWALFVGVLVLAITIEVPALADSYSHTDERHDVTRYPRIHAPHNRQADVTHVGIVHSEQDVRFHIRFRSASMHGIHIRGFRLALKTPGHDYQADFDWKHGGAQNDLIDLTTGQQVACDQTISRHRHTFRIRTDRVCLGNPRWIRAAFITATLLWSDTSFSDDPLSSDWRRPDGGGPFSPRVRSST